MSSGLQFARNDPLADNGCSHVTTASAKICSRNNGIVDADSGEILSRKIRLHQIGPGELAASEIDIIQILGSQILAGAGRSKTDEPPIGRSQLPRDGPGLLRMLRFHSVGGFSPAH